MKRQEEEEKNDVCKVYSKEQLEELLKGVHRNRYH